MPFQLVLNITKFWFIGFTFYEQEENVIFKCHLWILWMQILFDNFFPGIHNNGYQYNDSQISR